MKQTSTTRVQVAVPAAQIWDVVSQGGNVHRWFGRVITACELKGEGAGAQRSCVMADGAKLEEEILAVDHQKRRFVYAVHQHPLPAKDVVATVVVQDVGGGSSEIQWGAEYECLEEHAAMLSQMLGDLYENGIRSLETYCRQAA
jgi:uncharacterized protein YndB with AHSA1/START domain